MAKVSASEIEAQKTKMKDIVAAARKKPQNFAMLIAEDGIVIETDLRKPTSALRRIAKKNGGGSKGAVGQISVEGAVIKLACESDDIPGTLVKQAKAYFSKLGLTYRFEIVLPADEAQKKETPADEKKSRSTPTRETIAVSAPATTTNTQNDSTSGHQTGSKTAQLEIDESKSNISLFERLTSEFSALAIPFENDETQKRGLFKRISHFCGVFQELVSAEDLKSATASLAIIKKDLGEWKSAPISTSNPKIKDFPVFLKLSKLSASVDDLLLRLK